MQSVLDRPSVARADLRAAVEQPTSRLSTLWRRIGASLLMLCAALLGTTARAQGSDAALTRGLNWLQAQVSATGALAGEANSVATPVQVRSEAVLTLVHGARTVPAALLQALAAEPLAEAETLARRAAALRAADSDVTAIDTALQALQRSDGGVAAHAEAGVNVIDTAWALRAWTSNATRADQAASWLRQRQSVSGAWEAAPRSPLVTTALALRAQRSIASRNTTAASSASLAASWLLAQRNATTGLWDSSVWVNALAFETVHDYVAADAPLRTQLRDALLASQHADGSWQQDPFITALALRALSVSGQAPANPTLTSVTLQIVDSQSAAGLAGVAITLRGSGNATAVSDASGRITLSGLTPGNYEASLVLSGYVDQLLSFALVADRSLDLGRIQLSRSSSTSSSTVRFGGLVTASPSGAPLAGATVTVGSQVPVSTDAQGRWILSNVAPGNYSITVAKAGYLSVSATVNALAGREYDFSPSLQTVGSNSGTDAQGCRVFGTIRRGADGQPVPGAAVTLGGANGQSATADASGAYLIGNLTSGRTTIAVTAAGYDSVAGVTTFACQPPLAYDYSPRLYASGTTPSNANTSSLTFTLVDAATEQVMTGVAVRATPLGQSLRSFTSAADGRFTVDNLNVDSVLIEIAAQGFDPVSVSYQVEPLEAKNMGQIRLRPGGNEALLPDLRLVAVRRGSAVSNAQTLRVSGAVEVAVVNAGKATLPRDAVAIAFIDVDRDARFDPSIDRQLGQTTLAALLLPNQSATLQLDVAGQLPFRDAPIHVWIDSDQVIAESNESNNIKSTADAAEVQPAIGTFKPKLKWHWDGTGAPSPEFKQVMMAPVIGRVIDTNGDGKVDHLDAPAVVFTTYSNATGWTGRGVIRVVDGRNGANLLAINDPTRPVSGIGSLALADLDRDGKPEILAITQDLRVIAFRNDGSTMWVTVPVSGSGPYGSQAWGSASVADLDGDGSPEVLFGRSVFAADGQLKWVASGPHAGSTYPGATSFSIPLAADLFGTGSQNLILGGSAYSPTGSLLWQAQDGFAAVADLDSSGQPSIALVQVGTLSVYSNSGQRRWSVPLPGGGWGGPPTIADMDGDGVPDIGVAGAGAYTVFRRDGSVLWSRPTQDQSSHMTGSTVFDFDGDGVAEVLYGDETRIRAYRGISGEVLWDIPNSSITAFEYPVVADIDADGHADLVTIANDDYPWPGQTVRLHGIRVFEDENNSWVNTRSVWNQHAYSITNVNDDLTIPARPQPSWLAHNTFRLNRRLDVSATAVADATASYLRVRDGGAAGASTLTVRIGNGGALSTPVGMKVAFYAGAVGNAMLGVMAMTRALAAGEFADVSLDVPGSLASMPLVTVVADDDGAGRSSITDFDRSNNTVQGDLSRLAFSLTLAVATDKTIYTELDAALFTATAANAGSFTQSAQVRFTVETADGLPVQVLPLPAAATVAAAAQAGVGSIWPAAGVLAGAYRVRAELIDAQGIVYASALASFTVEASNTSAVGSRISADRVQYTAAQTVALRSRVFNATANMVVDGLRATTRVLDSAGQAVFVRTEPASDQPGLQLAARASREYSYAVPARGLPPGEYSAQLEVRDDLGNLRTSSSLRFTVLGTDYSGVGLRGSLDVPITLALGESAAIAYGIVNGGNAALNNLPLTLRLVDPAAGALRGQFALNATLAAGAAQAGAVNWQANGQVGDIVAVLVATIGGREQVLAQAPFKLTAPQVSINLALAARTERDARVLVLMSCPVGNAGNDDAACVQQRSNALGAMLTALGVTHRIVTTAADFESEMRCGVYNTYWLSGGAIKLSHQAAKELREAVRRGDGLIADGVHDSRNQLLHPVAGVKQIGKLAGLNHGAAIAAGSVFDAGTLATLGQPTRFELTTGQPIASFGADPAIVLNRYGEGASVLHAYDLAAMIAAPGGSTNAQLRSLVQDSLDSVAASATPLTLGDIARLATSVINRGATAVAIVATATLPTGTSLVDAMPVAEFVAGTPSTPAQVVWRVTLAADATIDLSLRVRIDTDSATTLTIPVAVSARPGSSTGAFSPQGSVTHDLAVVPGAPLADAALAAIEALAPTRANDRAAREHAIDAANAARAALSQGNAAAALGEWIKAADWIAGITSDDVATLGAAQLAVSMALEGAGDRLCRQ